MLLSTLSSGCRVEPRKAKRDEHRDLQVWDQPWQHCGTSPLEKGKDRSKHGFGLEMSEKPYISWASWEQASVWEGICHALLPNRRTVRWLPWAQPGESQGGLWGAMSNLEGRCQHLSAPHTCSPAGAEPRLIPSLPQRDSGVGFCLASTLEVPRGCSGGAMSSQVQRELRVGLWLGAGGSCSTGKTSAWAKGRQAWLKADQRVSAHQGEWQ